MPSLYFCCSGFSGVVLRLVHDYISLNAHALFLHHLAGTGGASLQPHLHPVCAAQLCLPL